MLGIDVHYGKHVRTFVQFKSGLESFRIGGPRPIDEKKLDFQNAFLDVGTSGEQNWIKLRVGRQELEYGAGRLIDVREGPNVRLSFTGFRTLSKVGSWHADGFAIRPDVDKLGFFDNVPNSQVEFWGVYSWRPLSKGVSLDAYYLGLDRKEATYRAGNSPRSAANPRHQAVAPSRREGTRMGFRLRRCVAIWHLWLSKHPRMDTCIGHRLHDSNLAAKAEVQPQGRCLQRG